MSEKCQKRKSQASFDHRLGSCQQCRREFQSKRSCRFLIKHKFVFRLLVERNVTWLCAPQYFSCHVPDTAHQVYRIDAISHEAADLDEITKWVDCRDMKFGGEVNDQLTVRSQLGG